MKYLTSCKPDWNKIKNIGNIDYIKLHNNISLYFGDPQPEVLNGKITNIEEDMIEITLYPSNIVIYIDFKYSGIPRSLNIEKIVIKEDLDSIDF